MSEEERRGRSLVHFGVIVFGLACGLFFALGYWVGPPEPEDTGHAIAPVALALEDGSLQATLDARDQDAWVGFSLELGREVPEGAASDLLIRRHFLRAPRGARDLGKIPLEAPSPQTEVPWVADVVVDGVPRNPALSSWYSYSYMTHLLRPDGHTFEVRLSEGTARVRVESYYCKPEGSGCLTLRYRLLP